MPNSKKLTHVRPDSAIWEGLQSYASLPAWVITATDPLRVIHAMDHGIPEFTSGNKILRNCDIHHVRYKDGKWSGTYKLEVEDKTNGTKGAEVRLLGTFLPPDQIRGRKMEVTGRLGEDSWYGFLPEVNLEFQKLEPEKVLAALSLLTDPEGSRQLLEKSIRAGSPRYANLHIEACTPKVVRYKPGSRCTVVYQLEYPQGNSSDPSWPNLVVAKTYRNEKGVNAYQSMRAVWESPLGTSKEVAVAEPLAYLPDMRVLVQGPIREQQTLKEMVRSAVCTRSKESIEEMFSFMRKTAAGVVALHTSRVQSGLTWTWENELAVVQEQVDNLAASIPALKVGTEPLINQLVALALAYPPDRPVPSHGSFRPAQVLISDGKIGFIDFDSFCQSEPALDLALFLGNVKSIGLTAFEEDEEAPVLDRPEQEARLELLENACRVFLDEYETSLPVSHQRISLWETLDLLTIVIHSWTKVKPVRLQNTLFLLEQHLRRNGLVEYAETTREYK